MLNLPAFQRTEMNDEPFRWGTVAAAFESAAVARALADDFPLDHMRLRESRPQSDKAYRMLSAPLVEQSRRLAIVEQLPLLWQRLIDELFSPGFTDAVSTGTAVPLADAGIEIRASGYAHGCFLSPHTDRADKLVSLVVYLESDWSSTDGGELSILRSSDPADEAARVVPRLGTAAVLVRSDQSWHQVLPVHRPRSGYRRSVLVHYWA